MGDNGNFVARAAARAGRCVAGAASLVLGLGLLGAARAAQFQKAPSAEKAEEGGGMPDTILGIVHVNTLFFIAVGVFAFFWFVFGGGRKAKVGRKIQ